MKLYSVRRNVGVMSQEEMDAAAFRAIVCAAQFPGLKWRHSYWNPPGGYMDCIYEADDAGQLADHAKAARIPCDAVVEVQQVTPETYVAGA